MSISPIFNGADLFPHRVILELPVLPTFIYASTSSSPVLRAPSSAIVLPAAILDILDDESIASHSGAYRHFIVRWRNCPIQLKILG